LQRLEDALAEITRRLYRIERLLGVTPIPVKPEVRKPAEGEGAPPGRETPFQEIFGGTAVPRPAPSPVREIPRIPAPSAVPAPEREAKEFPTRTALSGVDIEALIGGRWALWVGSLLVFLAVGFFLAYTWQNIPEWSRIIIGCVAGALFLGAGEAMRDRLPAWFVRILSGSGIALFYLSIWAAYQRYQLVSFDTALVLMVATTVMCVYLSLRFDSPGLLAFATLGGFLTPVLLDTGNGGGETAFSFLGYIALLDASILAVSLSRRWRAINFFAFGGTFILLLGWSDRVALNDALKALLFAFVTVYFLLFLGTAAFYSVRRNEPIHEYDLVLLLGATLVYALAGQSLIVSRLGEAPSLFILALALFYSALFFGVRSAAPANVVLRRVSLGVALLLFTLAVPIQLRGHWIAVTWSLEALLLASVAFSVRSHFLRYSATTVWLVALLATVGAVTQTDPGEAWRFLANSVALPLAAFAVASFVMGILEHARPFDHDSAPLSAVLLYCGVIAGAGFVGYDTYQLVATAAYPAPGSAAFAALCALTIVLSVYALAIFGAGLWNRIAALQGASLLLVPVVFVLPLWSSFVMPATDWRPFLNLRWLAFVVVALTAVAFARLAQRYPDRYTIQHSAAHLWTLLVGLIFIFVALNTECFFLFSDLFPDRTLEFYFNMAILGFIFAGYLLSWGLKSDFAAARISAYALTAYALWILLYQSLMGAPADWLPLVNYRGIAFLVAAIVLIVISTVPRDPAQALEPSERSLLSGGWVAGAVVALWGLTEETFLTVRYFRAYFTDWQRVAQLAISLVWTASAGILMTAGFWRNLSAARWLALVIFGITIVKLFVYDLSFLSLAYRWLSFGALGIVLIAIAYLYARRRP
jgi:uncharacterized membrane protein